MRQIIFYGFCLLASLSCAAIDDPDVGSGPPLVLQAPTAESLKRVAVRNPELAFQLNGYLDLSTLDQLQARFVSGAFHVTARLHWNLQDKELIITPRDPLRAGLRYTLYLDDQGLRGLGDRGVAVPGELTVQIAGDATVHVPEPVAPPRFGELIPGFEHACGCHDDPQLLPLDGSLLWRRSSALPERRLVVPYEPAASYLVHKLLPDYPDRFGDVMPPAQPGHAPLSREDIARVIAWIEAGAVLD